MRRHRGAKGPRCAADGSSRAAPIRRSALFPPLEDDDFSVAPPVSIFADQQVVFIRGQSIAAAAAFFVQLVSQVYPAIVPKAYGLPAGQGVGKVDVSARERVEVLHLFHARGYSAR